MMARALDEPAFFCDVEIEPLEADLRSHAKVISNRGAVQLELELVTPHNGVIGNLSFIK